MKNVSVNNLNLDNSFCIKTLKLILFDITCFESEVLISQQQIRSTKQMLSRPLEEQANSERLTALRKKFVTQALKYLGVPYAKRYHEPGSKYAVYI